MAQLAGLRASRSAEGEERAALGRAAAARDAEADTARRRLVDAERRLAEETARRSDLEARRTAHSERRAAISARLAEENAAASQVADDRESARLELDRLEAARSAVADRIARATEALAGHRGRLDALERRIAADQERGIARAARRRGGRQVDADLVVDAPLRSAVEAVLADRRRAYVVARGAVGDLAAEHGSLIVEERLATEPRTADARERRCWDRTIGLGGGALEDAVRRDASGAVRRLLRGAVWLPDLAACLDLQPDLAPGWLAVTRDGSAVVSELAVTLGVPEGTIHWQADAQRMRGEGAGLEAAVEVGRTELAALERELATGRAALAAATARERGHVSARREAEEAERRIARDEETILREVGWHEAQVARLSSEVERLREDIPPAEDHSRSARDPDAAASDGEGIQTALGTWEARGRDLRGRRDELAAELAVQDGAIRSAHEGRARAEATAVSAEARIRRVDEESAGVTDRARALGADLQRIRDELMATAPREDHARSELARARAEAGADRLRLADAEGSVVAARERVRSAEERSRGTDRLDLEARLAAEALREQVLVELAGLGEDGIARLRVEADGSGSEAELATHPDARANRADDRSDDPADDPADDMGDAIDPDVAALEQALSAAAEAWAATPAEGDPPTPGRLASLRRRYHELGAANPYAVEEYDAVRERLATLDAQESDLRGAISGTRELIVELNALIATQFRATFTSLESAFDHRFQQLFGGGFARLSLTDPEDLSSTGVEIVARPPGKKPQALAMLSGGERALTAVALLFAMLTVRPVPFCVLDEVDAALDEANVGRFADVLRELSARTQFIVITHNRGTIEQADALYGVTVGDDSVSRVISLRLDEAQAIAARASTDGSEERLEPEPEPVAG